MTATEKEIKADVRFSENDDGENVEEAEIIDCIDSCLNYLGRGVSYTVYLNWSAVDRKKHQGILGDPRSFRTSLYGLFGEEQGSLIETFLVKKLRERFPIIKEAPEISEESDFVTVITWLTQRARDSDFPLEEERKRKKSIPAQPFFEYLEHPMDLLDRWFTEGASRVGMRIRILSNLNSGMRREDLESELAGIRSSYEEAVDLLRMILKSTTNRRWSLEQKEAGVLTRAMRSFGSNFSPEKEGGDREVDVVDETSNNMKDEEMDPLIATANALKACSELYGLSKKVESMKENITGLNPSSS
jgi:hypothetical protein